METKGKVDVLQVMDDLIYGGFRAPLARENGTADAARAAVAELIEAVNHVVDRDYTYIDGFAREVKSADIIALRVALSALRSSQGGREGDEGEGRG